MAAAATKLTVTRSRTIQVFGPYTSETCTFTEEFVVPEGNEADARRGITEALDAALNTWERELRADIAEAAEAKAVASMPGFTTADKVAPAPAPAPTVAPQRTTPPPSAMRDVTDGTADELRRLGSRLAALDAPYEGPMPSSEADAQALVPVLRARIFDLEQKQRPAPPAPAAPGALVNPQYPKAEMLPAGKRICTGNHPAREPRVIDSRVYDYSVDRYGRPLCRDCQRSAQPVRGPLA